MNRRFRKYLLMGGGGLFLAAVVAAAAVRLIDVDRYRPQAEAAIHEATGLDCSLGRLSLRLWPLLHLHSDHPTLGPAGQPILQAERITISAKLLPLLRRRLEIRAITIRKLTGAIRRDRQGNLNLLPPGKSQPESAIALPVATLHITKIVLADANLRYEDAATGFTAAANGLNGVIGPLPLVEQGAMVYGPGRDFLATATLCGDLKAKSVTLNALTMNQPALHLELANNTLTVAPCTALVYGGKLEATITLADLAASPRLTLAGAIDNLDLARLAAAVSHKGQVAGRLQVAATLTTAGTGRQTMLRRLNGAVAMHGKDLVVETIDLDTVLTQYAKSQEFGLFDLGSIFIIGPFGPLLSKTLDLSGVALGMGRGSSRITQLASDWSLKNGVATAKDVAFATPKHRLAFHGGLDFPAERFVDFRIGVLNPRGCATFTQTVNGSFRNPQVEKTSFLAKTIVNPLLSLFRKGATALTGGKPACTPFYHGRVPHPVTP